MALCALGVPKVRGGLQEIGHVCARHENTGPQDIGTTGVKGIPLKINMNPIYSCRLFMFHMDLNLTPYMDIR